MDASNRISALNLDDLELNDLHIADVPAESAKALSQTTPASHTFDTAKKPMVAGSSGSSVWH